MVRENVVNELQDRLDVAQGKAPAVKSEAVEIEEEPKNTALRHAATEPVRGSANVVAETPAAKPKVGLMRTPEGTLEFVMLANGIWNSIKPGVKTFVLQEASAGELGAAGDVIKTWH